MGRSAERGHSFWILESNYRYDRARILFHAWTPVEPITQFAGPTFCINLEDDKLYTQTFMNEKRCDCPPSSQCRQGSRIEYLSQSSTEPDPPEGC